MVRLKDRYLLVNIIYSDVPPGQAKGAVPDLLLYNQPTSSELRPQHLLKAIRSEVSALFGDCGLGAIDKSLQAVKYLSPATSTLILRVSRAHYRLVWAALSFMDRVPVRDGRPCAFRVVRVSGTIRKVEEEAVRRAKLLVLAAKDEMAGKSSSNALGALLRSDNQVRSFAVLDAPNPPVSEAGDDVIMSDDG
ncbi:Rpp14/Pop5 family-domain-containing protein [Chaetomium strumarium]|uniref:Ribonuclease P/MRP protein subunit POP5 n=1 Tax=Chaetomium strumarium TaxID=1170767 RepID=A0AAJ0M2R8_9PEZI|nr:Rpp14/Pop5 family-domain-containing protein [Chaetomium strumarium]